MLCYSCEFLLSLFISLTIVEMLVIGVLLRRLHARPQTSRPTGCGCRSPRPRLRSRHRRLHGSTPPPSYAQLFAGDVITTQSGITPAMARPSNAVQPGGQVNRLSLAEATPTFLSLSAGLTTTSALVTNPADVEAAGQSSSHYEPVV